MEHAHGYWHYPELSSPVLILDLWHYPQVLVNGVVGASAQVLCEGDEVRRVPGLCSQGRFGTVRILSQAFEVAALSCPPWLGLC